MLDGETRDVEVEIEVEIEGKVCISK
jgi:hypothetical protein